ncbi:MAG: S46 family peptidase [Bacteroidales bacterium]|nr:S46 family peptidase [Bacteroidales bacterium]
MKKIFTLLAIAMLALPTMAWADEGMWIPMLLGRNEAAMKKAGMHISAKDIYDVNNACLKDAVMLFGSGCTGEFVSPEGLVLTNHHCGYSFIVRNSTVEHDYLTNGFWAMTREEEIPCPGLTVTRLVRMEDVTSQVLQGVTDGMTEADRDKVIDKNIEKITAKAVKGTHYKAVVKPFYYGNQYFMYVNEIFSDVRLVGAPPSSIGKFGGDTDNWMWPRHTGDFSMFRVYAGKDNKPADFSEANVPYAPLKHLEISLKGINEGDFTFVFGYPGTTHRYATHDYVDMVANAENPARIDLRQIRLDRYNTAMAKSAAQRLKYASRVASIANGWKKWQGENMGIERLRVVRLKDDQENKFKEWAKDKPQYSDVLYQLEDNYSKLRELEMDRVVFSEAIMASDFMVRARQLSRIANLTDKEAVVAVAKFLGDSRKYYEDFESHTTVDQPIFVETAVYAWQHGYMPYMNTIAQTENELALHLISVYNNSILNDQDKLETMLSQPIAKIKQDIAAASDPALELYAKAYKFANGEKKRADYDAASDNIQSLMRTYVKGLMEMYPDSNFFPDANLTLRVTYGHVKGFKPKDGVYYTPYTTLDGVIEKANPSIYDYAVDRTLRRLWYAKDYGPYANAEGELPVAFIATNHTTGGNSGSPVLNADGQLVGINFDRCWEGTMSDLYYDPTFCRNISLDIRYCLFIIDKYAGAHHLIAEMTVKQ